MQTSELVVGDWLRRQRCHWVFIDQSPNSAADGALRVPDQPILHRPDILALTGGIGSIAIDVKNYEFLSRPVVVGDAVFVGGTYDPDTFAPMAEFADEIAIEVSYVRLSWEEIKNLLNFQRASAIPTWLCVLSNKDKEGENAFFYRVDEIANAFAFLLDPAPDRIVVPRSVPFRNWPAVELGAETDLNRDKPVFFDFIVEDTNLAESLDWIDWRLHVSPRVIDLRKGTSIFSLAAVVPAAKMDPLEATAKMRAYASAISKKLKIPLPNSLRWDVIAPYIRDHKVAFDQVRFRR